MSTSCTWFWSPIPAFQADASLTESMSEQRLQRLNEQLTAARKEAEASGGMGCQGAFHHKPAVPVLLHTRVLEGQCSSRIVACYVFIVGVYAFESGAADVSQIRYRNRPKLCMSFPLMAIAGRGT